MATKDTVLRLRVTPQEDQRWRAGARDRGLTLSDFMRAAVSLFLDGEAEPQRAEGLPEQPALVPRVATRPEAESIWVGEDHEAPISEPAKRRPWVKCEEHGWKPGTVAPCVDNGCQLYKRVEWRVSPPEEAGG